MLFPIRTSLFIILWKTFSVLFFFLRLQGKVGCAPGGTRTPDPLLRRQLLCPAELQALHFTAEGRFSALISIP